MFKFTLQDIKNNTDQGSFERGLRYQKQNRVKKLTAKLIDKSLITITAQTMGSQSYTQRIDIKKQSGSIIIDGDCSCPVGFNCKHVVAASLRHMHEQSIQQEQEIKEHVQNILHQKNKKTSIHDWLETFEKVSKKPKDSFVHNKNNWIAYLIRPAIKPGALQIQLKISGYKKNGGFVKERHLDYRNTYYTSRSGSLPQYFNPIDETILSYLGALENAFNQPVLEEELGWRTLKLMIETKRCFWEKTQELPMTLGPTKSIHLEWEAISTPDNSNIQLICKELKNITLLNTVPLSYINDEKTQIGCIDTQLTYIQIEHLLNMPEMPEKKMNDIYLSILEKQLDQFIPPPASLKINVLDNCTVTPKATLNVFHQAESSELPAYYIKLSWIYDSFEIEHQSPLTITRKTKNSLQKICRNPSIEENRLSELTALGFSASTINDELEVFTINWDKSISEQSALALWKTFLEDGLQTLSEKGWIIEYENDFNLDFIELENDWSATITEDSNDNDWFNLSFDVNIGEHQEKLSLLPILSGILLNYSIDRLPEELHIQIEPSKFIVLKSKSVLPILKLIYELFDSPPVDKHSIELSHFETLYLNQLSENLDSSLQWNGGEKRRALSQKLSNFSGIKSVAVPKAFKGELKEYQKQGLNWLQFLREFEFNGILADDMGLGKTVQTLAHLQKEKSSKRLTSPCLIVAPTSLMSNWKREASIFTPNLKVLILQGNNRHQHFESMDSFDLILTTYPLIVRDFKILSKIQFHYIILDEAQYIKNPKAKATQYVKQLTSNHRLALTGTPMENHLGELWSIFDFLMPDFLGSQTFFKSKYRAPIEKSNDSFVSNLLKTRISPFLLRRNKMLVAHELPPRTEITRTVSFENTQSTLYESIRLSMEEKIQNALSTKGLARSHITILDALLKLRQVCCDPRLLKLKQAEKIKQSAKLEMLMQMLPELVDEGRKVLVFSQFTSMLKLIEDELNIAKINYTKLTGSTKDREQAILNFTEGEADVFLISLKAGGVGLNLTEADTVIHYDPWWNPAVENQASDRAHRIGQDKPVFVYKLVVEHTLEEKILEMQERKQALADKVYGDQQGEKAFALTAEDISDLLAPIER